MAESTTIVNACDVGIWLDNASGTPKDIGGETNKAELKMTKNVNQKRVFGNRGPRRMSCGDDWSASLTILYSTATDEALDILRDWAISGEDAARTLALYVPDKNVGSDHYSGEFILASLNIPLDAEDGGPIEVTAELLIDGDIAHSSLAT
jgi:hypothetical protein